MKVKRRYATMSEREAERQTDVSKTRQTVIALICREILMKTVHTLELTSERWETAERGGFLVFVTLDLSRNEKEGKKTSDLTSFLLSKMKKCVEAELSDKEETERQKEVRE